MDIQQSTGSAYDVGICDGNRLLSGVKGDRGQQRLSASFRDKVSNLDFRK